MPKAAKRSAPPPRRPPPKPLMEHLLDLNEKFGHMVHGRTPERDEFATERQALAEHPRPSDEELRDEIEKAYRARVASVAGGNG